MSFINTKLNTTRFENMYVVRTIITNPKVLKRGGDIVCFHLMHKL
jgi:hypothetical protein